MLASTSLTTMSGCGCMDVIRFHLPNDSLRVSGHHFFAMLIATDKVRAHVDVFFARLEFYDASFTLDGVAGEHGPMKLKSHFASDEVHIAADLRRDCRSEQTVHHQAALFIGLNVMNAFIARDLIEEADVLFGKCSLPGDGVANLHFSLSDQRILQT